MAGSWQHVVVAAAAVVALAWLIRRKWKKRRGCADCALAEAVARGGAPAAGRTDAPDAGTPAGKRAPGEPAAGAAAGERGAAKGAAARKLLVPLLALALVPGAGRAAEAGDAAPRNLVLIVVDTLRQDHVGAYGDPRDPIPSMTRLAARGVQFERAYSTAPWTKSSVASILTGLYPDAHGVHNLDQSLPQSVGTLAEILAERGYRRAAVVSNLLLSEKDGNGFGQGFETYLESEAQGHNHVSSAAVTDQAIDVLSDLSRGSEPFFLFVLYFDPHYNWIEHPELGFSPPGGRGRLHGTPHIRELTAHRAEYTDEEIRYLRELYDGEIAFTDVGIRRLLQAIDEMGRDGDTVVALTADHGEEFRERGWIGHTRTLYEELLRVPLVVAGPGLPAGRLVQEPVSLVAAAPTLMELMGLDPSGLPFQESSFAALARGDEGVAPPLAFGEVDFDPVNPRNEDKRAHKKAVVVGDWKLVRDDTSGAIELFDLAADPAERHDLSGAKPELRDRLLALLEEREALAKSGAADAETRQLTEEELERLRGLGYVQ